MDDWRGEYYGVLLQWGEGLAQPHSVYYYQRVSTPVLGWGMGMGSACNADRAVAVQLLGRVVCGVFYIKDMRVN